jgi:predicted HNH restriction endonuclease
VKQSKAKGKEQAIEVHHKTGIQNWENVIDVIYQQILCSPATLEVLCPDCHEAIEKIRHGKEKPEG